MYKQKHQDDISFISYSTDIEFVTYAKHFQRFKYDDKIANSLQSLIKDRLTRMGYSFKIGCCGTNEIKRIINDTSI